MHSGTRAAACFTGRHAPLSVKGLFRSLSRDGTGLLFTQVGTEGQIAPKHRLKERER